MPIIATAVRDSMYNLDGKIAVVTGAGSKRGLGRAIALRLAEEGVGVAVVDKDITPSPEELTTIDWNGIQSVGEEITAGGGKAMALKCDITISKAVDQMVQEVVSNFGKIDILVNNAGIYRYMDIVDMSDAVWAAHIAVNLTGAFYCTRAVARKMMTRNQGGRIINIASLNGKTPTAISQSAYCTSKFGLIGFTQSAAKELARHNILVNAVCPGLVETELHSADYKLMAARKKINVEEVSRQKNETVKAKIPLGRLGVPEDVAKMVAFLCSEEAGFITGQAINVNGGIFTAI